MDWIFKSNTLLEVRLCLLLAEKNISLCTGEKITAGSFDIPENLLINSFQREIKLDNPLKNIVTPVSPV